MRFCGECADISCDIINAHEYKDGVLERCQIMKLSLVKAARQGITPVSVCGHHCDYCFLGKWCGGCRSDYNCCSFATLFEDSNCPNVVCANAKGVDGCYECSDLDKCNKGYYSRENEYAAKATAMFIREYGQECYTNTLKKAIDDGINYPKSFDEAGSATEAYKLLENYLDSK